MCFSLNPIRVLILLVLLAVFAVLGGFTPPAIRVDVDSVPRQIDKAWFYCMILFVVGAIAATLVDHSVGIVDPVNLRFIYIVLGVLLMVTGALWNHFMIAGLTAQFQGQ